MWLTLQDIEAIIVVSETGEQWSPKIAPVSIAPVIEKMNVSDTPEFIPIIEIAKGKAVGKSRAIVPQDVPVAKLTIDAVTKTTVGNSQIGIVSDRTIARNSAVSSSVTTALSPQAKTKITTAVTIDLIPASQAETAEEMFPVPDMIIVTPAVREAIIELQIRTLKESAPPIISLIAGS